MRVYMHTLDDQPAEFQDGMVCLASHVITRFARDLDQIREEQALSILRRRKIKAGFTVRYGYHVLHVGEEP